MEMAQVGERKIEGLRGVSRGMDGGRAGAARARGERRERRKNATHHACWALPATVLRVIGTGELPRDHRRPQAGAACDGVVRQLAGRAAQRDAIRRDLHRAGDSPSQTCPPVLGRGSGDLQAAASTCIGQDTERLAPGEELDQRCGHLEGSRRRRLALLWETVQAAPRLLARCKEGVCQAVAAALLRRVEPACAAVAHHAILHDLVAHRADIELC
jgi:hypothetical protein